MKTYIEIKKAGEDYVWARRVARAIKNVKDALEPYAEKHGYYKRDELCSMLGDLILIEKSSPQRTKLVIWVMTTSS